MSNLPFLKMPLRDSSGNALVGGKMNTYEAGTSTPLATYAEEALSTPLANPVLTGSDGYWPEIYFKDQAYKLVITDASDVAVYTVDNVNPTLLWSSGLAARQKQIASNPLDYRSAVGDGVADEYLAVQDAIDAATGVVDLLGKTFRCDSGITLTAGLELRNGVLDFSQSGDDEYIMAIGSRSSARELDANGDPGDVILAMKSGVGWSGGDWGFVYSGAAWEGANQVGEMFKVNSVSGANLLLTEPLRGEYLTASSAWAREITTVKNVKINNVRIITANTASGAGKAISLQFCENAVIENVRVNGIKGVGVELIGCVGTIIDKCSVEDDAGAAVGVDVSVHSKNTWITNSDFNRLNIGVRVGQIDANDGVCYSTYVDGCKFSRCAYGVSGLIGSSELYVHNCEFASVGITSSFVGILSRGVNVEIKNNKFIRPGYAVDFEMASNDITGQIRTMVIVGNRIEDSGLNAIFGSYTQTINEIIINNNVILSVADATDYGINLAAASTATTARIMINNNILNSNAGGISVATAITAGIDQLLIASNQIDVGTAAIEGIAVVRTGGSWQAVSITDNQIVGTVSCAYAIKVEDANKLILSNNMIDTVERGIFIDNDAVSAEDYVISGNVIRDSNDGIWVVCDSFEVELLNIVSNSIEGINGATNFGIFVGGMPSKVNIAHNNSARTDAADANIYVEGDGTGTVESVNIHGNTTVDGVIAIEVKMAAGSTMEKVKIDNNVIDAATAGILVDNNTGTITDVIVNGNEIEISGNDYAIKAARGAANFNSVQACNNLARNAAATARGIWVEDATNVLISGNVLDKHDWGIYFDNDAATCQSFIASNNVINADGGIMVEAVNKVDGGSISGNNIYNVNGSKQCIAIVGLAEWISISGNISKRNDDTADNFFLDAANGGDITHISFTGNMMENGDYMLGDDGSNSTTMIAMSNAFIGSGTGDIENAAQTATTGNL